MKAKELVENRFVEGCDEGLCEDRAWNQRTELVTYLHPGGHEFPLDALTMVVEFFKRLSRE